MNDAVPIQCDGLLTTADLAAHPDFTLGLTLVCPSSRAITGPGGTADVEPRVMQVLVLLVSANGQVVTRESLFQRCWGSVYVGDDSLNRTIAAIRKLAMSIGDSSFEIETIPRTGYRLVGEVRQLSNHNAGRVDKLGSSLSRRNAILAGGTVLAAASGGAIWIFVRERTTTPFDALMARGDEAFHDGTAFEQSTLGGDDNPKMVRLYEQAVRLRPDSAKAWGLLGYFKSAAAEAAASEAFEGSGKASNSAELLGQAQAATRRALEIDPDEPNARVGIYLLQGTMYDWATRDHMLRGILATDPKNLPAMMELMPLVQAAGLTRESWTWNERMLHAAPFTRVCLTVRAFKLWIMGRDGEADNVIDRVRALWPQYQFAIYARLVLFALTGRPAAARALLASCPLSPVSLTAWRVALDALETKKRSTIELARVTCAQAAQSSAIVTNDMVMLLCALGLTDTAFEVTEGFLLWRGKMVSGNLASGRQIDDYNRRMSQWLFTPPVAIMRSDARFKQLCDAFGLTAYWRARGVRPDYQVYG